jgi:AcrR family transcriptional regulator
MQAITHMLGEEDSGIENTRQRIIDAALRPFGQAGYVRASTRTIAQQADVNEVTLFRHFGSKKGLLLACIRSSNRTGFAETFHQYLTGDYPTNIRIMARLQMADTQQHVEILRLLLCDSQTLSELQEALVQGTTDNRKRLAGYFRQQVGAGTVRADPDPMVLAHGFDSLFLSSELFKDFMGTYPMFDAADNELLSSLTSVFIQGALAN